MVFTGTLLVVGALIVAGVVYVALRPVPEGDPYYV